MGGKMSVSKAQSVYGIPHSTLEYKVKERLGTLKHPPKKKLKLTSNVEEEGLSLSPDGIENTVNILSQDREKPPQETGNVFNNVQWVSFFWNQLTVMGFFY